MSAPGTPGAAAASGWPGAAPSAPFFTGAPPPGTPYSAAPAAAPYPSPWPSPAGQDGGAWGWSPQHQHQHAASVEYLATPSKRSRRKSRGEWDHEHAHAMKHSSSVRSRSRSRSRMDTPLNRSLSYSGASPYGAMPAYARGDMFDEQNLSRRPTDWRSDYVSSHSGVLDILRPVVMKHKTIVQGLLNISHLFQRAHRPSRLVGPYKARHTPTTRISSFGGSAII